MDVTLEHQIQQVAQEIKDAHGSLDLLVNCSAMLHPSGRGETSLKQVQTEVCKTKSPFDVYFFLMVLWLAFIMMCNTNLQDVDSTLRLNCIAPLIVVKNFLPLLQNGNCRFQHAEKNVAVSGIVVNMSAKVGSITDNG